MIKDKLVLINEYVEENRQNVMNDWSEIVNLEGFTKEVANVTKTIERVKEMYEAEGLVCELIDVGVNAPTLVGTIGSERPGKPIVFSGHLDTVYPTGTFKDGNFIIKDGNVHGPGVLDMKGGVIIALYVIKALNKIGYNKSPLKIIFSGDEENGHSGSDGAKVFEDAARGGLFAFNMETGRADNSLCIGRKGRIGLDVIVKGISSHAGNDFESGRNAIEEMAHKIIKVQAITDLEAGTSVNCGVIEGGTVPNAIPEYCKVAVDIRYKAAEEADRIKNELAQIASENIIDQTSIEVVYTDEFSMFETNDNVMQMYELVKNTAEEFGFRVPGQVYLGGCSDAAYVGIAGTPVLCAFGVLGQWNHTLDEYAIIDSMYERVNLISAVVLNQDKF